MVQSRQKVEEGDDRNPGFVSAALQRRLLTTKQFESPTYKLNKLLFRAWNIIYRLLLFLDAHEAISHRCKLSCFYIGCWTYLTAQRTPGRSTCLFLIAFLKKKWIHELENLLGNITMNTRRPTTTLSVIIPKCGVHVRSPPVPNPTQITHFYNLLKATDI